MANRKTASTRVKSGISRDAWLPADGLAGRKASVYLSPGGLKGSRDVTSKSGTPIKVKQLSPNGLTSEPGARASPLLTRLARQAAAEGLLPGHGR